MSDAVTREQFVIAYLLLRIEQDTDSQQLRPSELGIIDMDALQQIIATGQRQGFGKPTQREYMTGMLVIIDWVADQIVKETVDRLSAEQN
jgi:hypothetical protein